MTRLKLRESIATEAARLILRGKETEYGAARRRAARWLSKRKLGSDDIPSDSEIHSKLYALAGFFSAEQQQSALSAMRESALDVMTVLTDFQPRVRDNAVEGPVTIGSEITIEARADTPDEVASALESAGYRVRSEPALEAGDEPLEEGVIGRLQFHARYPCKVLVNNAWPSGSLETTAYEGRGLDAVQLRALIDSARSPCEEIAEDTFDAPLDDSEYHPDTFALLRMLLARLEDVGQDPERHPEGDALYHSLQVYHLGLEQRPYDEEFLLACLLHDVGLGIDRRDPIAAAVDALEGLLTERTCFLIEHRSLAREYLKSGKIRRSLRRSEHFDDLVLLAQCDLQGRVPGAPVDSLDEVLDDISALGSAWDDV